MKRSRPPPTWPYGCATPNSVCRRASTNGCRSLSATPVGNNLTELYNLIQLLRPGLLQGEAQFRREYGRIGALSQAGRRDRLRELLREVMVRNTRAHIDLKLPKRIAATHTSSGPRQRRRTSWTHSLPSFATSTTPRPPPIAGG